MKYWILPATLELSFMGIGIFMFYSLVKYTWFNSNLIESDHVLLLGIATLLILCFGVTYGSRLRLLHHKLILKKAGLWTDEEIRKKDIPKD